MPAPPSHSGPVILSDFTPRGAAPKILRESPLTVNGQFGAGWQGTIDFLVESRDLYAFAQFATGNPYTVGSAIRYIPLSHPDAPGLLCTGIRSVARGGFTTPDDVAGSTGRTVTLSNWSHAQVSCSFTSVPYATDGSTPFMTKETIGSSQEYSLADKKLIFPSDGKRIDADATLSVPTVVYVYTIYMAYALDDSAMNAMLANPVSSASVGSIAAGLLRFDNYRSSLSVTQGGQQAYTRTIQLAWRPIDWNYFLRPEVTWEAPEKPDSSLVYGTSDLNALFS